MFRFRKQRRSIDFDGYEEEAYGRWTFQVIVNSRVSVDTFFAVSGLLMTFLVMKELDRTNVRWPSFLGKFYFHRYWRLTPPYMFFMMAYVPLFKYLGDGPFWKYTGGEGRSECEDNWYYNLLYINNFVDERNPGFCMAWSWYLANDMQFFWFSPIIFIPLYYLKNVGMLWPSILLLSNLIFVGVQSKTNGFSPGGGSGWHEEYYTKPYCRIGAYIVGMMTGYVLYKTQCKARIHPAVAVIGWMFATVVGLSVMYGLYGHYNGHPQSEDTAAFWNSIHRPAWALSICWVIFACANGYGGPINTFLSWNWLLPLSRLTYCAYMVHWPVMDFFLYTQREPFYVNNNNIVFSYLGILWVTFFLAFINSMTFEGPFLGLEKLVMAFFGWVGSNFSKNKKNIGADFVVSYSKYSKHKP